MGAKQSCPSDALDPVWVDDKDASKCFNCGVEFTLRRRRHHCRGCGIVVCNACWGQQISLEEAYGFPGPVPVCTVCSDTIQSDGSMALLRRGIQVAFTHEPRSSVTADSQIPPLANANIKARKFTTNVIRLFHWRPFTRRTQLQLQKAKSSREVLRSRNSGMGTTPRGESGSMRMSATTPREGSLGRDSHTGAGGGGGDWTIDLAAVESIQLLSFSEKDGGEFICISTDFEEHRLQAVKVRFEEIARISSASDTASSVNAASAASAPIPIPSSYTTSQTPGAGASSLGVRGSLGGDNNSLLSPDVNSSNSNAGGEQETASDRRSAISSGTRLRTVMLDKNGTRALYNSLLRAHQVCQRRTQHVPPEVRAFVEVDVPYEELEIGASPGTTPRMNKSSASVTSDEVIPIDRMPRIRHSIV